MIKEEIIKFDIQNFLNTQEDVETYLESVLAQNDQKLLTTAIGDIIKSKGYSTIAQKMNVNRESLYKSFDGETEPKFKTVYNAIDSLGFRVAILPKII